MRASTKDSILPEVREFIQENGVNRDFLPGMRCNRPCNTCHVDVAGSGERVRHILGLGITHILLLTYSNLFFTLAKSPYVDELIMDSNMALLGAASSPSVVGLLVWGFPVLF